MGTQEGQEDPGGCGRREAAEKGHSPSSGQRWPVQGVPGSPGEREQEGMGEGGVFLAGEKRFSIPVRLWEDFPFVSKWPWGASLGRQRVLPFSPRHPIPPVALCWAPQLAPADPCHQLFTGYLLHFPVSSKTCSRLRWAARVVTSLGTVPRFCTGPPAGDGATNRTRENPKDCSSTGMLFSLVEAQDFEWDRDAVLRGNV